jgi:hypothetical protein
LKEAQQRHVEADAAWRAAVTAALAHPGADTLAVMDAARTVSLDATCAYHAAKMAEHEAPVRASWARAGVSREAEIEALKARLAALENR